MNATTTESGQKAGVEVGKAVLSELVSEANSSTSRQWLTDRRAVLQNVMMKVHAVLGSAEITVARLSELGEGQVLALAQDADMPVELWVDGHVIGIGQLVVVGEKYGIRITELAASDGL